ncbi:MAG: metallophosphatase domain-containing protein [Acidobacteria bacterium]|nr:metallophosphatase domain-containing protein [Acidobacteriota bacterium]
MNRKIRIVAISDTHSRHQRINVPEGDILIHAGDVTMAGGVAEIAAFDNWLGTLPHPVKLFCAGNHDLLFERNPALARSLITNATYLQDELIEAMGLRIYFSPWQPRFFDWAFNLDRGAALRAKWDLIPWPLDVLVTHGPPMGILDVNDRGEHCGCEELRPTVERGRPRVHIFGHIHESYGTLDYDGVRYVNASICDGSYRPVNPPVVIDLEVAVRSEGRVE